MTAVMKWRRAKAARPTEPARIHLYFPSDDLGKRAKAAFGPDHARIATGRDRTCSRRRFSKGQAALLIRR
jgi:hypothetical protein